MLPMQHVLFESVITSERTPEPGVGSVVSSLPASEVLLLVSLYNVTHAACVV
jgi:hypothetical protein